MTRYSKTMSEALEEVKEASARADARRAMSKDKDMKQNPFSKDDDATDDDVKAASKNIIMQLRKSVSMKGNHAVEFSDGKKKIDPKFAQAAMDKFMRIRKSDDKLKFQNKLAKSYKDLLKALKEQYEMVEEEFELELEEGMKMNDPKLLKMFDKLKKGSKIKLKTSSTISQGKDYVEYIVKSKNTVNKGRVEKITLATVGNEKAVKKFLYKRDGTVGFAIGDMGASIDDIKEGTWALPDSPKAKAELKKLMSKPIKLGKEGDDAADKLYALIGDDELFDDLYVAGKKNPNGDARDVVKKHMKRLGIKEEVELEEKFKVGDKVKVKKGSMKSPSQRHYETTVGTIVKDYKDGDFKVNFGGNDDLSIEDKLLVKESVELDEAKSATGYEIFHKDFSSAMQHATAFAKSKGQPIKKDEIDNKVATGPKKPSKGKENSYTLETEKGKRWSVQVYNMGNKFELNMYLTSSHVPEGDMLDEEDEKKPDNRPDSAKEVDQGRDDKKKTRIAQLQLQIAKATETINKLNAQEK